MSFLIELLILVPTILVTTIVNAGIIMGMLYLLNQKMGASPEIGSFDFTSDDKKLRQEFILRCVIHGAIGAAVVLVIAFILYRVFLGLRPHDFWVALMLAPVHYAALFLAAGPLQKIERNRALILAATPTLVYLILHGSIIGNLLH